MKGSNSLEWVLFAETAKGPHGTTLWHFFNSDASSTEFSRFCNALARDNYCRTDIITSPTETAGLRPDFKGHAYFPTHSSSNKSEGFSIHLFVAHPDAETAKDTSIIFHGESDFEQSHAGSNVLRYLHIGSAGDQEFGQHLPCADDSRGLRLNDHPLPDFMGAGSIYKSLTPSVVADLDYTDPTSPIRGKMIYIT